MLVAFHDVPLDRVTDRRGPIGALTWDEVRRARIGGREPIPLMDDLLTDFPDARFNIDAKSDAAVGPLVRPAAARPARSTGSARVVLRPPAAGAAEPASGPDVAHCRWAPGRWSGWSPGPGTVPMPDPLRRRGRRPGAGPVRAGSRWSPPNFVRTAHRLGLEVHVWTINDPAEMDRLLDLGVDGLITDRPDLLRDVLRRRGGRARLTARARSVSGA